MEAWGGYCGSGWGVGYTVEAEPLAGSSVWRKANNVMAKLVKKASDGERLANPGGTQLSAVTENQPFRTDCRLSATAMTDALVRT